MKASLHQLFLGFLMLTPAWAAAHAADPDFMRSSGKIYVVIAVIVAVFVGIVLFLVYLDRRLTKLENQIEEHDQA